MDLATALDLKSPDDVTEAKFMALKALHAKKIKALMVSLEAKDKDIAKLKVLGKDSRRTQMIQALRDKIRSIELVTDVVKEELGKKAEMSPEEVNEFVIRKTISGPKRFRPLTREELENKVVDLEKKIATKKIVGGSVSGGGLDARSVASQAKSVAASEKSAASRKSRQRDESKEEGDLAEEDEVARSVDRGGGGGGGNGGSGVDTARIVQLMEEVEALRLSLDVSEGAVELQKEEVSRLRERNSQLVAGEEESDFATRQYREMRAAYDAISEDLEVCTRKLTEATEENMILRGEADVGAEQQSMEIDVLHDQCERLLAHNSSLLEKLGEMELEVDAAYSDKAKAGNVSASAEAGEQAKAQVLQKTEKALQKLKEQLRASEGRVAELTAANGEITLLTDKLREKNVQIRDMNRKLDEARGASLSPDKRLGALRPDASVGSLGSVKGGGSGEDVAVYRRQIADLKDENKQLSQALASAALGKSPPAPLQSGMDAATVAGETALLANLIDSLVQQGVAGRRLLTVSVSQSAEKLLKILDGAPSSSSPDAALISKDKVVDLLSFMDGSAESKA